MACPIPKTLRSKLLVLGALILTTVVSFTTLFISITRTFSTRYLPYIQSNRATIQIVVHIISATLGALQMYVVSSVIQFRVNTKLCVNSISLDKLKLWGALNLGKADLDLPRLYLAWALLNFAIIQAPAAIWAGAITPVIISTNSNATYRIPFYDPSTIGNWGATCRPAVNCGINATSITTEQGTFTNIGWKFMSGLLLNALREASNRNSPVSSHKKLDNSGFSFYGRSYGVASGVGLVDSPSLTATNYSYSEPGYMSKVQCIYNQTSNLTFANLGLFQGTYRNSPFTGSVRALQAVGSLPTGEWTGFTTMGIVDNSTAFAIAAQANDTHYSYGLMGGNFYTLLDKVQCEVTFSPMLFSVSVDVTAQNITVTPTSPADTSVDIDPSRGLVNSTFYSLNFLSQILSTMYTGVLADAFMLDVDAVQARNGHVNATESDILGGVTEGLELLLDFYFGTRGASQLMQFNESTPVSATIEFSTVQLGEPAYVYASFGINLAVFLLFAVQAWRTGFWRDLPLLNCLDVKSALVGLAASGPNPQSSVRNWTGDAGDRESGRLTVQLGSNRRTIILDGDVQNDSDETTPLTN